RLRTRPHALQQLLWRSCSVRKSLTGCLGSAVVAVRMEGRQRGVVGAITQVLAANTDLMGAFSGDFDLGGVADVREVDLLGANGTKLSAQAGYVEIDRRMYRIMTINIPIVINDAFSQVALWLSSQALVTTSTSVASTSAVTSPRLIS